MRKRVSSIVLNMVLLVLGVVTVYPFLWMLASSFKKNSEIVALHQTFLPKLFTVSNYISMNSHFNFMRFFANSIFITLAITVIVIYTSTLCGFVLSKYRFKGRDALFGLVLATMMIPWCVTIIPRYSMIKAFGCDEFLCRVNCAGVIFRLWNLYDEAAYCIRYRMKSWKRPGLTEPMSFIFFTRLSFRWRRTESQALQFFSSYGRGRTSCGRTW